MFCSLAVSACVGKSLYKQSAGPYEVNSVAAVTLNDPVRSVDVTFRSWFPEGDGPFPVVVFSTGGFCGSQMYERILHHWVSHGYVLIAPDHVDSPNRPARPTPEQMQSILQTRVRDLSFTVDALTAIRREAGFAATLNTDRLAIAGHSFGSGVAMMKSGLLIREQDRGPWGPAHDPRFTAAIALSPPGTNDELAANAFSGLDGPFLATGGTNDLSRNDPGAHRLSGECRLQSRQGLGPQLDQAFACGKVSVIAGGAEMAVIADAHIGHAAAACLLDGVLHGDRRGGVQAGVCMLRKYL